MFAKPVRYPVAKESQLAVSQSSLLAEEPLRIKNQAMNLKAQIETILLLVKAGTQQEAEAMEAFTRTLMQGMPGFLVA